MAMVVKDWNRLDRFEQMIVRFLKSDRRVRGSFRRLLREGAAHEEQRYACNQRSFLTMLFHANCHLFSNPKRTGLWMWQTNRIQVPGRVRQPLLGPAPVVVFARDGIAIVESDSVFVVGRCSDAVDNSARRIRVFVGAEEHIRRVAVTAAHEHARVERVTPQNPVKLVPRIGFKLRLKGRIICEEGSRHASGRSQRGEPRILTLPPWSGFSVVWEEECGAHLSATHAHKLARISKGIVDFGCHPKLEAQRLFYD